MLWNIHGEPTVAPINLQPATIGDNTILTGAVIGETYVHGLMIIADGAATVTLKFGSRTLGIFKLAANQTVNMSDIVGMDGEPILKGYLGEAFVINSSAAVALTGMIKSSLRNY